MLTRRAIAAGVLFVLGTTAVANGSTITPISGSTSAPIGTGTIANVIDGVPDFDSYLALGVVGIGTFPGPFTVNFDLGGVFNLTAFNLWNNAGNVGIDGEGINSFDLNFLDSMSTLVSTYSASATDALAQQIFTLSAMNVSSVDLVINSNHAISPVRSYVSFYEVDFTGTATPESSTFALALIGMLVLGVWRRNRLNRAVHG